MSKTKSSSKLPWSGVDKRVRDRREAWNAGELEELDKQLSRLPDVAEQAEIIDVEQPAVGPREAPTEDGEEAGSDGDAVAGTAGAAAVDETN